MLLLNVIGVSTFLHLTKINFSYYVSEPQFQPQIYIQDF